MSYCRWSTDDFQCDLYVYYSVGDFYQIYVANNKVIYKEELPPRLDFPELDASEEERKGWADKFLARNKKISQMIEDGERVQIGLPYDGQSFECETEEEAISTLKMLKEAGYRFPDYVIEVIEEEKNGKLEVQEISGGSNSPDEEQSN